MPRRAAHLNREAIEEALTAADIAALRSQCVALGIPPDRWDRVPALAVVWATLAVLRSAARIEETTGASSESALIESSVRLGVSYDTMRSRIRRMALDAYAPTDCS